jgi:hypothetical protein
VAGNEMGIAFGILMLAYAMVAGSSGWIVGAALGWLAGCKYYGFEIGALAFFPWLFQNRPGRRGVLQAIGVMALTAGFWYFRNIYLFANPIFPYFHQAFSFLGSARVEGAGEYAWRAYSQFDQFASPTTLVGWLTTPIRLIATPEPRFVENEDTAWKWVGWLAFVWPIAIAHAVKYERRLVGPYAFLLLAVFFWAVIHGIIYLRFLTPLLSLMYLLSFATVAGWLAHVRLPAAALRAATLVTCLVAILHLAGPTTNTDLAVIPLCSNERDVYLQWNVCGWPVVRELNRIDPPPVVYFLYGESTRHYCRFPVYAGWRGPQGFARFHEKVSSPAELASWLENMGVDVLVVNHARDMEGTAEIMKTLADEDFSSIYRPTISFYYSTSVFVHRNADIHFYLEDE